MRGIDPFLEHWLSNLPARKFEGRNSKGIAKTVTKQRVESHYDLELCAALMHGILDMTPESVKQNKAKTILQHLSEAGRLGVVGRQLVSLVSYTVDICLNFLPSSLEGPRDADSYREYHSPMHQRQGRLVVSCRSLQPVDKAVVKKNLGRLTRIYLKAEQERQHT